MLWIRRQCNETVYKKVHLRCVFFCRHSHFIVLAKRLSRQRRDGGTQTKKKRQLLFQ